MEEVETRGKEARRKNSKEIEVVFEEQSRGRNDKRSKETILNGKSLNVFFVSKFLVFLPTFLFYKCFKKLVCIF